MVTMSGVTPGSEAAIPSARTSRITGSLSKIPAFVTSISNSNVSKTLTLYSVVVVVVVVPVMVMSVMVVSVTVVSVTVVVGPV